MDIVKTKRSSIDLHRVPVQIVDRQICRSTNRKTQHSQQREKLVSMVYLECCSLLNTQYHCWDGCRLLTHDLRTHLVPNQDVVAATISPSQLSSIE